MRSEFEKLPEISWRLRQDENLFNEKLNQYLFNCEGSEDFVNGAWYAFQEQQKKIDVMKSKIQDIWTNLDDRQSKEWIVENCENIIQELLK